MLILTLPLNPGYYGYMALFRDLFFVEKGERGQILLIVVLTTIVALTVGLSVASRTITNLKISKQNEESQRAFQAAEAGVEKVLQESSNSGTLSFSSNGATFTTTITQESGSVPFLLNNGEDIVQDVGQDVWLSNYPYYTSPTNGAVSPVTIRWQNGQNVCNGTGSSVTPAIEVVLLTGIVSNPTVVKHVYDSCPGRISGSEVPGGAGPSIEGVSFTSSAVLSNSNMLIMKVIPLFNSVKIGIEGNMPSQGNVIESIGSSGDTKRKIVYFESYPQLPPELFYVIMSQ